MDLLRRHYEHNAAVLPWADYTRACAGWRSLESTLERKLQERDAGQPASEVERARQDLLAFLSQGWIEGEFTIPVSAPSHPAERDAHLEWTWRGQHYAGPVASSRDDFAEPQGWRRGPIFLHPDLGSALQRELEAFSREILLRDLEATGGIEGGLRRVAALRRSADVVLAPLARLEAWKNRLFERPKPVLRSDYLLPLQRVPRSLWPRVAQSRAQLAEWRALYGVELECGCESSLEPFAAFVVNTAHFPPDVTRRLLSSFQDPEGEAEGQVIHAEAFQALGFLADRLGSRIDMVFFDPPYNTGIDGFAVKEGFGRSSWLTFMEERLTALRRLLTPEGILFASIGTEELGSLRMLLEEVFGRANLFGEIVWKNGSDPRHPGMSYEHEYVLCAVRERGRLPQPLAGAWTPARDRLLRHCRERSQPGLSHQARTEEYQGFLLDHAETLGDLCRYRYLDEAGEPYALAGGDSAERHYLRARTEVFSSVLSLPEHEGAEELENLFGKDGYRFDCPNPVAHVERLLAFASRPGSWILDPMAGTGTTADAVIRTNRRDGSLRRFVLIEAAEPLDSLVLPRIQKVMAAPEWQAGRPVRFAEAGEIERGPRLVQVLRLESYEDALQAAAGRLLADGAEAFAAVLDGAAAGPGSWA